MKTKLVILTIAVIMTVGFFSIPPTLTNMCNSLGIYDERCPRIGGIQIPFGDELKMWNTEPRQPNVAVNTIDGQKSSSLSENNCGQFYTVPPDNHHNGSETYPVLILKQNSIGCAKITYTINYNYNDNRTGHVWPRMINISDRIHLGKYNYIAYGNSYGVSPIDTMQMFKIRYVPEVVDLAKYPVGSQFTVTLVIQPLPNATGFYDYSIEEVPCVSYPLVVGYSPDRVNSSDFSKGMGGMHNHSCYNIPYEISLVQVSGIDFKLVKFQ